MFDSWERTRRSFDRSCGFRCRLAQLAHAPKVERPHYEIVIVAPYRTNEHAIADL
jgi:hypothetical protein